MKVHLVNASALWVLFSLSMSPVFAQTVPGYIPFTSQDAEMTLSIVPESPRPGETVQLTLTSSSLDLNRSTITWYANDSVVASGEGLHEARLVAGALGVQTTVRATATSEDGTTGTVSGRITPAEIDLIFEGTSYVPPFYKGRSLPGTGGEIRVYALVRFNKSSAAVEKDIIYTWYRNGTLLSNASGRGKSRLILSSTARFDTDTIRVVAESPSTRSYASETLVIPRKEAKVLLYENHPLFGILFHRAIIGDVNTNERQQKVSAYPFYSNVGIPQESTLAYAWKVNNIEVPPSTTEPNALTIEVNDFLGPANIELSLVSSKDLFMHAEKSWRILFGETISTLFDSPVFGQ